MKQEPVAWIEEDGMVKFDVKWASQMQDKEPIPLYTEPQYKNLSDEEIKDLIVQHIQTWNSLDSIIDFARAILKKASEK